MASGMAQLLKTFGIDPDEIRAQALQFRDVMVSIDNRMALLQAQNSAIMKHLGITDHGNSGQPSQGTNDTGNVEAGTGGT